MQEDATCRTEAYILHQCQFPGLLVDFSQVQVWAIGLGCGQSHGSGVPHCCAIPQVSNNNPYTLQGAANNRPPANANTQAPAEVSLTGAIVQARHSSGHYLRAQIKNIAGTQVTPYPRALLPFAPPPSSCGTCNLLHAAMGQHRHTVHQ